MATTVVTAKFVADTADLSAKLSGVQGQLQQTSSRMAATGDSVAAMGRQMTVATAPIVAFGAVATKAFLDFDDKMTQSLAIMSGVTKAMRAEMEATARTVATTFGIAADKAAESYFFLASAGLDAEQSMAALPQVAAFATAGMFDMATATDLATDAQSALGLTVDDAAANLENLTRVTDVLVKANTLANATVEQFSIALTSKAGAAMKAVNKDIEEGVAVLSALADQGIKAQLAGNQLAIVMRDLQSKAIKEAAAFEQFGVRVFDAAGNMNNLADIIGDLETATAGMSDEQKRATFGMMDFSDRSLSALMALLGTSDAIREYEEELRNAGGTTQDVAEKQLESFAKQLEIVKTRVMDLAMGVGQTIVTQFLAPMIDLMDKAISAFEAIPGPIRNMAVSIGLVVALAGPLMWMFGAMLKGFAAMTVALTAANTRVIAFAARSLAAFKSVGVGAGTMGLHVAAALTSKRVALEVAGLAAKKFAAVTVAAMRTIVGAFRGLLAGLGPIGIALIAAAAAFEVFSGKSAAAEELVNRLKDSVDELTGAFGEATAAAISAQFRTDLSAEDIQALADMGISIQDMTRAAMEGGPAAEAYNQKLQDLINSHRLFSSEQDLLITTQRNYQGMIQASDEAKKRLEADAQARADAAAIEGQKARAELEGQINASRGQTIKRAQDLANMTAAEKAANAARVAAADAALAKDNALIAVTKAAKDAVTALEGAMNRLNEVIGNQNARNAAIRSTRDLSKELDKNGTKIKGTSEAAMKNQDAIANAASAWIRYAQQTEDPIKQQERLKKGEEEIRAALEKKGIDPEKSPIVRQFNKQLEKSQETVDEFKKRAAEANDLGIATGRNFIQGIIESLRKGKQAVGEESEAVGAEMPAGVDRGTNSQSPSKEGMKNAQNFIDGVIAGLRRGQIDVNNFSFKVGGQMVSGLREGLEAVYGSLPQQKPLLERIMNEKDLEKFRKNNEQALISLGRFADGVDDLIGRVQNLALEWQNSLERMRELSYRPLEFEDILGDLLPQSEIQKAFGADGTIDSIIAMYRNMRGQIEQIYQSMIDAAQAAGLKTGQIAAEMRSKLAELESMVAQALQLQRQLANVREAISTLSSNYAAQVKEINRSYDAADRAASAAAAGIQKHWDGVIKGLQKRLQEANEAFNRENQVLQRLIQERDSFLDRIRSGMRSFVNNLSFETQKGTKEVIRETKKLANGITTTIEREIEVGGGVKNIREQLQARLDAVREFSTNIRTLMARGLDPTLVQDFVSAGASGAGEAAKALVAASDDELRAINGIQSGLASEVAAFADYASQQWFDAGIRQQEAIVAPFRSSVERLQAELEAAQIARDADIESARAYQDQLRADREAALAAAEAKYLEEKEKLEKEAKDINDKLNDQANDILAYWLALDIELQPRMKELGVNIIKRIMDGLLKKAPELYALAKRIAARVKKILEDAFDISSPSGFTINVGAALGQGLVKGLDGSRRIIDAAAKRMANRTMIPLGNPNALRLTPAQVDLGRARLASEFPNGVMNVQVTVNAAPLTDPAEVGRQVVEAIKTYERSSGPVYARAS